MRIYYLFSCFVFRSCFAIRELKKGDGTRNAERERPRSERPGVPRGPEAREAGGSVAKEGSRGRGAIESCARKGERDRIIRSAASSRHRPVQNSRSCELRGFQDNQFRTCQLWRLHVLFFVSLRFPTPSFEMFEEARNSQIKKYSPMRYAFVFFE